MSLQWVVLVSRVAQLLVMLLTVHLQTTLLNPEQLAVLALVLAGNAFFALVLQNPIGTYCNRHLVSWRQAGVLGYAIRDKCAYLTGLGLLSLLAYTTVAYLGSWVELQNPVLLIEMSGLLLVVSVVNFLLPSLNLLGKDGPYSLLIVTHAVLTCVTPVLTFYFYERSVQAWLLGLVLSNAMTMLLVIRQFQDLLNNSPRIDRTGFFLPFRTILQFSWPILVSTVTLWAIFHGYRFIVSESVGLGELGLMYAGYGLSVQLFGAAEQVMNSLLMPRFYTQAVSREARPAAFTDYFNRLWIAYTVVLFVILSGAPALIGLLLGEQYQQVLNYLLLGAFVEYLRVLANAFSFWYHVEDNTKRMVLPSLVMLAVFAVVAYVAMDAAGVMWAMFVAVLIYVTLIIAPCRKMSPLMWVRLRVPLRFAISGGFLFVIFFFLNSYVTFWVFSAAWIAMSGLCGLYVLKHCVLREHLYD